MFHDRARRLLTLWAMTGLIAVSSARSQEPPAPDPEMSFRPYVNSHYLFGMTSYHIQFDYFQSSLDPTNGIITGESQLDFDLKALMLKVGFEAGFNNDSLTLDVSYAFPADEAPGIMRDRDWTYNHYANNVLGYDPLWSESLSDTKSPVHVFDVGFKQVFYKSRETRFGWLAGFQYQKLGTFEMYGFAGSANPWPLGLPGPVTINTNTYKPSLTYDINYKIALIGLTGRFDLGSGCFLETIVKGGGVTFTDQDEHLLRFLHIEGWGDGPAGEFTGTLAWRSPDGFGINVFASYTYLKAEGIQSKYFYDGPTAGKYEEVPLDVKTGQTRIGMEMSYRFSNKPPKSERPRKSKKKIRRYRTL